MVSWVGCHLVGGGRVVQDLVATVELLIAEMPGHIAPVVGSREDMAARIARVWQSHGGSHEGIAPFVRYWLTADREWRRLLVEQRASSRRAMQATLQTLPCGGDAA